MRRRAFGRLVLAAAASPLLPRAALADDAASSESLRAAGEATQIAIDGGKTIAGSLTLPKASKPPVVLIVPGSGPIDRNGNSSYGGLKTDVYAQLAAGLATRGMASVRYDKRGIGASAGAATSESSLRFDDYVSDAALWIAKLQADSRFSTIAIAGHSEGSLVGMIVADTSGLDAFVSLEGAGRPLAEILRVQLAPDLRGTPNLLAASERILAALSRGETTTDVPAELAPLFRPSIQPYLISAFRYDPAKLMPKAGRRAGIVQGTADIQVSVDDAKLLAAARPDAKLTIVERLSHVLKIVSNPSPDAQFATAYADPSLPLAPEVLDAVAAVVRG